ncbi:hypothetical protein BDQ17DRAFT_1332681 [Cyathus striatus]|nr:hypothetical protein BDQ17DRAFT_1332681 [Cyathus striatus]
MSLLCHMIAWSEWDWSKWSKTAPTTVYERSNRLVYFSALWFWREPGRNLEHTTTSTRQFLSAYFNPTPRDMISNEKGKTALMQECGDYTELLKVLQDLTGTVLEAREGSRKTYEVVSRVKGLPGNACFDGREWLYTA